MNVLTHDEILELLDMTRQTLWRLRKSENPPPVFKVGGEVKCFEDDLLNWLERKKENDAHGGDQTSA